MKFDLKLSGITFGGLLMSIALLSAWSLGAHAEDPSGAAPTTPSTLGSFNDDGGTHSPKSCPMNFSGAGGDGGSGVQADDNDSNSSSG